MFVFCELFSDLHNFSYFVDQFIDKICISKCQICNSVILCCSTDCAGAVAAVLVLIAALYFCVSI